MFKPLDFLYIYLIRNIWLMIYGVYKGRTVLWTAVATDAKGGMKARKCLLFLFTSVNVVIK